VVVHSDDQSPQDGSPPAVSDAHHPPSTGSSPLPILSTAEATKPAPEHISDCMVVSVDFSHQIDCTDGSQPIIKPSDTNDTSGTTSSGTDVGFLQAEILMSVLTPPENGSEAIQQPRMVPPSLSSLDPISSFENFDVRDFFAHRSQDETSDGSQFDSDRPWWCLSSQDTLQPPEEPFHSEDVSGHVSVQLDSPCMMLDDGFNTSNSPQENSIPEENLYRLQDLWGRSGNQRPKHMSTLWQGLMAGHGLFADPGGTLQAKSSNSTSPTWSMDEPTRHRVRLAFGRMLDPVDSMDDREVPSTDMFDIAFEQYVYHHHLTVPLLHLPTFCASQAPTTFLLVACTIGFRVMGTKELTSLVSKALPVSNNLVNFPHHANCL
jgi:hypothetical protein